MEHRDIHVHTTFSDGKNTPEEMIAAAVSAGITTIGFSDHSYTFFEDTYCIKKGKTDEYVSEITRLKQKYAQKIKVLCGIEQDYYSQKPDCRFDFVIGSVHYIKTGDIYIPVDSSADILKLAAKRYFNGDIYALTEEYYKTVSDVVKKTGADVIGHFDLITKFQEKTPLFDETNPRYIKAWKTAADILLKTGVPFEINTGAISRGYRTTPYPSENIRKYISSCGGKFILSSDSHSTESLLWHNSNLENFVKN